MIEHFIAISSCAVILFANSKYGKSKQVRIEEEKHIEEMKKIGIEEEDRSYDGLYIALGIAPFIVMERSRKHHEKLLEEMKNRHEETNRAFIIAKKQCDKIRYITNFIDEIPELSYYEAAQLKKKLGNIYVEWNDE